MNERPTILVPGRIHAHVIERVGAEFDLIRIERPDAGIVDPQWARRVRGIASSMVRVDSTLVDALPSLEIVANFGVGYDAVDAAYCASRGIMVTNTPDVLTEEVADTALGLILNTLRELPKAEAWLRAGKWSSEGAYPLTPMTLRGRKAGIFGLGRIGSAIARRLEAFGVPVAYHNRRPIPGSPHTYHASLSELAQAVDLLICIAPGGAATEKAIDADVLSALGPGGVFINVGRGSSVDEPALIAALGNGTIAAAGLDVFAREPHVPAELLALPNVCLLPHVASASQPTRRAMADLVVDNLVAWFSTGKPLTPVPETAAIIRGGGKAR